MSVDELARAAAGDLRRRIDTTVDPDMWMSGLQHKRARRTRLAWVSAAAATAVLVAAVGWIAIRPSDGSNSQPFDEPSPTPSQSVSPTPHPTDRAVGHVVQPCGGDNHMLSCSDYRGHLVAGMSPAAFRAVGRVQLRFDLPDSWRVLDAERWSLELGPATGGATVTVLLGPLTGGDAAYAEEILEWLASNTVSTEPTATTVGGRPAWDLQVESHGSMYMFDDNQSIWAQYWGCCTRGNSARIIVVEGINHVPLVLLIRDNPQAPVQSDTDITRLIDSITLKQAPKGSLLD